MPAMLILHFDGWFDMGTADPLDPSPLRGSLHLPCSYVHHVRNLYKQHQDTISPNEPWRHDEIRQYKFSRKLTLAGVTLNGDDLEPHLPLVIQLEHISPMNTRSWPSTGRHPIDTLLHRRGALDQIHLDERESIFKIYARTVHTRERQCVPVALDLRVLRTNQPSSTQTIQPKSSYVGARQRACHVPEGDRVGGDLACTLGDDVDGRARNSARTGDENQRDGAFDDLSSTF
ncbi:uncharacterized protein LAESUDRAFT_765368 [Laetiporus sulphureus 93-53]|uniref:Uncharacterized protein n=1 Tax=Laetiporus sulphureus 93-53 TaxID=1314785 RepID=A0A165ASW5_9APHY|nr:uncharacterized protein LAESUDRAFT_765368 [Laetiporus sulphureus 93-53]KZS99596.1 hypothetical protein LAESUDRAFT_765368 [Laetiporus sulphureus 93-53]